MCYMGYVLGGDSAMGAGVGKGQPWRGRPERNSAWRRAVHGRFMKLTGEICRVQGNDNTHNGCHSGDGGG